MGSAFAAWLGGHIVGGMVPTVGVGGAAGHWAFVLPILALMAHLSARDGQLAARCLLIFGLAAAYGNVFSARARCPAPGHADLGVTRGGHPRRPLVDSRRVGGDAWQGDLVTTTWRRERSWQGICRGRLQVVFGVRGTGGAREMGWVAWARQGLLSHERTAVRVLAVFLLGERQHIRRDLAQALRELGLYHLLVVSGMHVGLVVYLFMLAVRAPLRLLYASRIIHSAVWASVRRGSELAVLGFLAGLVVLSGAAAPAQRAGFVAATVVGRRLAGWPGRGLLTPAVLQSLVFPIDFVTTANGLSWSVYLLLVGGGRLTGWRLLGVQLWIQAAAVAWIGQLAPLALVANLVAGPALLLVIVALGLAALVGGTVEQQILAWLHVGAEEVIDVAAAAAEVWLGSHSVPLPLRVAASFLLAVLLLNQWRSSPIPRETPERGR